MKSKFFPCAIMIAATILLGACNGEKRPDGLPKLFPCSVKIIQAGAPLAGADVMFVAQDPNLMRWPAGGTTDETGVAKINTYGFAGAPEGVFKVLVVKTETTGSVSAEEAVKNMESGTIANEERFDLVAQEYRDQTTTPLSIEVKASGSNTAEFDVGEAVRVPVRMPGT